MRIFQNAIINYKLFKITNNSIKSIIISGPSALGHCSRGGPVCSCYSLREEWSVSWWGQLLL